MSAGVVLAWASTTAAQAPESGESLRARGEQLAKERRYSEAIDAFKAAEKLEPRARHACLIGLAYLRRELWPQAEIFLEQCEARATTADPVPEWMSTAKQQLQERLAAVNVAAVTILVEPAGAPARIAVSSFAPDELFEPRTIHLPPGRHVLVATAPGYGDAETAVEVADRSPRTVTLTLTAGTSATDKPLGVETVLPMTPEPPSKVPLVLMTGGAGLLVTGALVHLLAFKPARDDLASAMTLEAYREREGAFSTWRAASIGLYAGGAVAIGIGIALRYTVFANDDHAPQVTLVPGDGGGVVSVGWSR